MKKLIQQPDGFWAEFDNATGTFVSRDRTLDAIIGERSTEAARWIAEKAYEEVDELLATPGMHQLVWADMLASHNKNAASELAVVQVDYAMKAGDWLTNIPGGGLLGYWPRPAVALYVGPPVGAGNSELQGVYLSEDLVAPAAYYPLCHTQKVYDFCISPERRASTEEDARREYAKDQAEREAKAAAGSISNWAEFTAAGLLWWVNRMLHLFGWSIVVMTDGEGRVAGAYPARTTWRGFTPELDAKGFCALTDHMAANVVELQRQVRD